jgi:hypothetical protein
MVAKDSNIIHGSNSEGSTGAVDHEVHRVTSAVRIPQDLAKDVIENVVKTANLKSAFKGLCCITPLKHFQNNPKVV